LALRLVEVGHDGVERFHELGALVGRVAAEEGSDGRVLAEEAFVEEFGQTIPVGPCEGVLVAETGDERLVASDADEPAAGLVAEEGVEGDG
jgi:hypothetical protein